MGGVTFIPWDNQLAAMVREPGGVRIGDALTQAKKNLDVLKASCLVGIDSNLQELEGLCAEGGRQAPDEIKLKIYHLSNDILAVAGTFDLAELGRAAFCLCEMVDRFRQLKQWNQAAVQVHLSAFKLLRHETDPATQASVVEGLRKLVDSAATIGE